MTEISAKAVAELRARTGAGMMDCKKALAEAGGDFEKAIIVLREKGIAKAGSKEGRATAEGIIATYIDENAAHGVMVEINCETDFVARTDNFRNFANNIARHIATKHPKTVDELLTQPFIDNASQTVGDYVKSMIATLGENILVKRFIAVPEGGAKASALATYTHTGDKLAVLVEFEGANGLASNDTFKGFARDIAMHVAAASPLAVKRDEVDPAKLAAEREIFKNQAIADGKPAAIVDKIADGRVEKYYSEVVLTEQLFVKDNDKTVGEFIKESVGKLGSNFQVRRFVRFRLGE